MESFFTTNTINWLPMATVFANTQQFHDNHSYTNYYQNNQLKDICLENCTTFPDPRLCVEYCHEIAESALASTQVDPNRECTDWRCCKQKAGTNDYAYTGCVDQVRARKQGKGQSMALEIFFLVAMVFLFVMIKCT